MPWLTSSLDAFLNVLRKSVIRYGSGTACVRQCNSLGKQTTVLFRRKDRSDRVMIVFNDDLKTLPNFRKDGMNVACEFGFRDSHRPHGPMISAIRFGEQARPSSVSSVVPVT
jgi:hypothetical protein